MTRRAFFIAPPDVLTSFQTITFFKFFSLRLNTHLDLELLNPHPFQLPIAVYVVPLLIYISMNILVLSFLQSYEADVTQSISTSWVPAICTILILSSSLVTGSPVLEILLVVMPLTMSFIVLPWYFVLHWKRKNRC